MSFNLRLSPNLELRAKARAEELGISLNAIISVALDAYLNVQNHGIHNDDLEKPVAVKPAKLAPQKTTGLKPPGANSSKKERQQYTAFLRSQRKLEL